MELEYDSIGWYMNCFKLESFKDVQKQNAEKIYHIQFSLSSSGLESW